MTRRLEKLRQRLIEEGLDIILISQPDNCRYFSGFSGSAGDLLISPGSTILATDFRYIEQAESQAPGFDIVRIGGENKEQHLLKLATELGGKRLGFEAKHFCYTDYCRLKEEAEKSNIRLVPTKGLAESIRVVKEKEEIATLMKAAELASAALEYIAGEIHPGMKEREVAWETEKFLREKGSEPLPFDIIVASGPNAALPHAKPTERSISSGEPVIIDLGGRLDGYASDMTRTLCLGSPDATFTKIYELVLRAQQTAIDRLETGMSGDKVDGFAREVIKQGGYKDAFGHVLGHGLGLAVHELPRIGPNSEEILEENMVFTIEPGIYISGWGGVRIEDMVTVEKGRAKVLGKARK